MDGEDDEEYQKVKAASKLSAEIEHDPKNYQLYSQRCACYLSLQNFQYALRDAEKCVELEPSWVQGYRYKGLALLRLYGIRGAIQSLEIGLKLAPDDVEMQEMLQEALTLEERLIPVDCFKKFNKLWQPPYDLNEVEHYIVGFLDYALNELQSLDIVVKFIKDGLLNPKYDIDGIAKKNYEVWIDNFSSMITILAEADQYDLLLPLSEKALKWSFEYMEEKKPQRFYIGAKFWLAYGYVKNYYGEYERELELYKVALQDLKLQGSFRDQEVRLFLIIKSAKIFVKAGSYGTAEVLLNAALAIANRMDERYLYSLLAKELHVTKADIIFTLGNLYRRSDAFGIARRCFKKALFIRKKLLPSAHPLVVECLLSLYFLEIYTNKKNLHERELLDLEKLVAEVHTDNYLHTHSWLLLGAFYFSQGKLDLAREYYKRVLGVRGITMEIFCDCMLKLANVSVKLNDFISADKYYLQSIELLEGDEYVQTEMGANFQYAVVLSHRNEFRKGIQFLRTAQTLGLKMRHSIANSSNLNLRTHIIAKLQNIVALSIQYLKMLNGNHADIELDLSNPGESELASFNYATCNFLLISSTMAMDLNFQGERTARSEHRSYVEIRQNVKKEEGDIPVILEVENLLDENSTFEKDIFPDIQKSLSTETAFVAYISFPQYTEDIAAQSDTNLYRYFTLIILPKTKKVHLIALDQGKVDVLVGQIRPSQAPMYVVFTPTVPNIKPISQESKPSETKKREEIDEEDVDGVPSEIENVGDFPNIEWRIGKINIQETCPPEEQRTGDDQKTSETLNSSKLEAENSSSTKVQSAKVGSASHLSGNASRGTMRNIPADFDIEFDAKSNPNSYFDLHQAIWAPIEKHVKNIKNLTLSRSGILSYLPFEVLATDQENQEKRLCSLHIFNYADCDILAHETTSHADLAPPLVIADPDYDLGIVESDAKPSPVVYPRLSGARAEGISCAQLLSVDPILDANATKTILTKMQTTPKILHIATHSSHDKAGTLIFAGYNVYARGGTVPKGVGDAQMDTGEIYYLPLRGTKLVVLSACVSGIGHITSGGVIGLVNAFLRAGAQCVVASMCPVDDQITKKFMEHMYTKLVLQGTTVNEAVASAREDLRSRGEPVWSWGAFVVCGNGNIKI